jgi:hypothetical protein
MERTEGITDLVKSPVVKVQMKSALSKNFDLWKLADIKGKLRAIARVDSPTSCS